jgi:L-type amino acid transporter 9
MLIHREEKLMLNSFLFSGNTKNLSTGFDGSTTSPKNLALAFYGCLWSYSGW